MKHIFCSQVFTAPILLVLAAAATSCGIATSPHYNGTKDYGQDIDNTPLTASDEPVETPPSAPAPTIPTPPLPAPVSEPTGEEPPATSGQDLLSHYELVGYLDTSTTARIIEGSGTDGEISPEGNIDPPIRALLRLMTSMNSDDTMEIITHENGRDRQSVTQKANSPSGDFISSMRGDDSQSGTQTLDWVLDQGKAKMKDSGSCPRPFICVDRIIWQPNKGDTWTYCFRDADTNLSLSVPYAPNTQFGPDGFRSALPDGFHLSKPFAITKHPGKVSCTDPNIETRDRDLMMWRASLGTLAASRRPGFLKKAVHKPLTSDTEVLIEYKPYNTRLGRWWQPKRAPFVDQMSRFNTKLRYFLNSQDRSFVKIIRTVQLPLNLSMADAFDAFASRNDTFSLAPLASDAAIGLRTMFSNDDTTTGIQINSIFEFCSHKAVHVNRFNHCTGKSK